MPPRQGCTHQPASLTAPTPLKLATAASFRAARPSLLRRRALAPSKPPSPAALHPVRPPPMTSAEGEAPQRRGGITGLRGVELVRHWSRSPLFSSTQDWGDEASGVNVVSLPEDVNFVWPYPHAFPQESLFGTLQPMNRYSCGEGRPARGLL